MHQKPTKHERFYKKNNQLPIKRHDELEDNSNVMIENCMIFEEGKNEKLCSLPHQTTT